METTLLPTRTDFVTILPELVLVVGGMILLVVAMLRTRAVLLSAVVHAVTMVAGLAALLFTWQQVASERGLPFLVTVGDAEQAQQMLSFSGLMVADGLALGFKALMLLGGLLVALLAARYGDRFRNPAEFHALLVFSTAASLFLAGAADLLMIYLSLEFLSLGSYVLAGYLKYQPRSSEAAIKYFLYGAITAAVMLYGMSLLYGLTGATNLYPVAAAQREVSVGTQLAAAGGEAHPAILLAAALVLVGVGFKAAIVPFHQWVPDVYDGSPTPVMAWLSVVSKAAGFAVFIRVFISLFPGTEWVEPLAVLAALTMLLPNLAAIPQRSIKRLLAYSSVAHAGYVMMGIVAWGRMKGLGQELTPWQVYGAFVYLITYVFMNLGALAVVLAFYSANRTHEIDAYNGLAQRSPVLAWLLFFFLLSLAGLPPTAGFVGKFLLLGAAIMAPGLWWLAVVAFVATVISAYYYWRVVQAMFLRPAKQETPMPPGDGGTRVVLAAAVAGTALIFISAGTLLTFIQGTLPNLQ